MRLPFFRPTYTPPNKYQLLGILLVVLSLGFLAYWFILRDLPSPARLNNLSAYPVSTKILDRNGQLLYEIYDSQNRTPIKISDLPKYVTEATIAIEDKNFYTHHGFDTGGILRAGFNTLTGKRLEGGSTITQQLVKVALLTPERTLTRKIKEAILTVATEILYSKNQILEMYLNHIPYGGTSYGIEAAAHTFFNKSAKDLTLSEATLLVGLPQAPSRYSPFANPDLARARQAQVLDRMVEDKYITKEAATAAKNEPLHFADSGTDIRAPHFVMYVRQLLEDKYGVQMVEQGGLQVTTTLDLSLQDAAQATLSAEMVNLKKLKISNGAGLVTNPETGEILAMIGSKDYFSSDIDGKVNVTTSLRQPGSSIKPLNYALGLETKIITPSTMILDTPVCFAVTGQADYCPKNYDNTFRGLTQIRFDLGNSLNIPAVKVLALNGIGNFINFATKMGISSWKDPSQYGLSLTLGGGEVTMTDMATAFGVFANDGTKVPLHAILKVTDQSGKVLDEYKPDQTSSLVESLRTTIPSPDNDKVLSPETSFLISHILSDNNARSAAFGTSSVLNVPGKTVSVKTGTTNNLRDNWTIGYTKNLLVATWVGNNDNTPMSYVASGITGASPIWQKIMRYALKGINIPGIPIPDGIEGASVCSDSGTAPAADNPCPTRYEYFIKGTIPTESGLTKKDLAINRTTHHPPNNDTEAGDVTTENHTVAADPFIKNYCVDCQPYPDGYQEPAITIPYNEN
jgi:1A family penicillin-binding protein